MDTNRLIAKAKQCFPALADKMFIRRNLADAFPCANVDAFMLALVDMEKIWEEEICSQATLHSSPEEVMQAFNFSDAKKIGYFCNGLMADIFVADTCEEIVTAIESFKESCLRLPQTKKLTTAVTAILGALAGMVAAAVLTAWVIAAPIVSVEVALASIFGGFIGGVVGYGVSRFFRPSPSPATTLALESAEKMKDTFVARSSS